MSRIKKIQSLYENQIINYFKKQNIHISDIDSIWTTIPDNLWEDMLPGKDSKVYETISLFDFTLKINKLLYI
jgi:hypothetical protein